VFRVGPEHLIADDDRVGLHRLLCWFACTAFCAGCKSMGCQRQSACIGFEGGLTGSTGRTGKTLGARTADHVHALSLRRGVV